MMITRDEQADLVNKFDINCNKSAVQIDAFADGMIAMMELVDSKLKSEK